MPGDALEEPFRKITTPASPTLVVNNHLIRKYLVVKENMAKKNYCRECAALILRKAQEKLTLLIKEDRIAPY